MALIQNANTKKRRIPLLLLVFFSCMCGFDTFNDTSISAWIPYWDLAGSTAIFENHFSRIIDTINPFVYVFDEEANIVNICKDKAAYAQMIQAFNHHQVAIIPTITNDVTASKTQGRLKDAIIVHRILSDSALRQRHLQQIIALLKETNAQGVDIDYEEMDVRDKELFTRFIEELAGLLHQQGKTLSVTVQHKTEDHQRSGAGAIDWTGIARYADRIIIMCYNYSSRLSKPGPICPTLWLKKIIHFASSQIPRRKICIALPLHGYDWDGKNAASLNTTTARALIDQYDATVLWDAPSGSPHFVYYSSGVKHEVWFENDRSVSEKINIIKRSGISNIAFWHLGILDASIVEPLREFLS